MGMEIGLIDILVRAVVCMFMFCILLIYLVYANKKARNGRDATFNLCKIEAECFEWLEKNKDKDAEHEDFQEILKKKIIALAIFMKTHSIRRCDDSFEDSLGDLLDKLVDKNEFIITYKKLLRGLNY